METVTERTHGRWTAARLLGVGAIAGIVAGTMMAAVEMVYGWIAETHTPWDAPMGMLAWAFGIEHFGAPENHSWPIVLGFAGHMVNSMLVGVLVAVIVAGIGRRALAGALVLGLLYGFAVWALMRYAILPLNDGEARLFTTDLISPQWVWWVAHAAYGVTAGLVVYAGRPRERAAEPTERALRRAA